MAGMDVEVIGAGISGLTSALRLAEAGHAVRIRAAEPPSRTTSRVAGAMWGSTFAGPADRVSGWATESLRVFRGLAGEPGSGVRIAAGTLASASGTAPPPALFPGVEVGHAPAPPGFAAAFAITVPVIDMRVHLDHLAGRLRDAGVGIEIGRVGSLGEAATRADVVVNAAGLGARHLAGDPALRAVRGHHVVVENPGLDGFFMTEPIGPAWTSWFVHGDRVVLGGVAQEDDEDLAPRAADADGILERCATVHPRLRGARVLAHEVGLRPVRAEVRVESEPLGAARVIHDYGHGGTGVGLSWGCARDVAALAAA